MSEHDVLKRAEEHAIAFLDGLPNRPVAATLGVDDLRSRIGRPLPAGPTDPLEVIDDLVRDVDGGLVGSTGGGFFGFLLRGAFPGAPAPDSLTSISVPNP